MRGRTLQTVALVAISVLAALLSSPPQPAHTSPGDEISVVAPVVARVGNEFSVDIDISEADTGYTGYWAWLQWDSTILAYVDPPGVTYTWLGGMTLDQTPMALADGVRFGSARMSGCVHDTGTAAHVSLECIGTGTSALHLVSLAEDPAWGTWMLCVGGGPYPVQLVDAQVTCASDVDSDGDGCTEYEEAFGASWFYPGSTCTAPEPCYSDSAWYDFYDVPRPAQADPAPNGPRNQAVTLGDALAVVFYVGTFDGDGGSPNPNGVAYDSIKGSCDIDGDTLADREGLCYDRSPGPQPNPPWEAGPPNGALTMGDVLAVLAQVGLLCSELPTPTPTSTPSETPTVTPTPTTTPTPTITPTSTPNPAQAAIDAAIQATIDLIGWYSEVVSVEPRDWPDNCLGLGQPGEVCTLIITPGYRITIAAGTSTLIWRTNLDGSEVRLEDMY